MGILKDDVRTLIDLHYSRGIDGSKIAKRLIEAGLQMMAEEGDIDANSRIVPHVDDEPVTFYVAHRRELKDTDGGSAMRALTVAFGEMRIDCGDAFFVKIDDDGLGFSAQSVLPIEPDVIQETFKACAETFADYEAQHRAKDTPEGDVKAERNRRMKEMCLRALGEPLDTVIPAAREPQESDSGLPAPGGASRVSDAPLDRLEVLGLIDEKIAGFKKHGMGEALKTFTAFRGEITQHLEERPANPEKALRDFYIDCHSRSAKAGWWNDLATGQPKKRSVGELFVLMVTELSEAYRAYLTQEPDDKLPQYPGLGVEIGDLQIRLADFAGALISGMIVENTGTYNPGAAMLKEICEIADRYESIRKTPQAKGDEEQGDHLPPQEVAEMVFAKLEFNATRPDHKIENRKAAGGKQT